MNELLTIGYERATLDDFMATLSALRVGLLIDVRAVAVSRKPGFSKTQLSRKLGDAGISYVHILALGDPKAGREAARRGDHITFERIFREHLGTDEAREGLETVRTMIELERGCLMCFERDHKSCHRTIVAEALSEDGGRNIRHVGVRRGIVSTSRAYQPEQGQLFAIDDHKGYSSGGASLHSPVIRDF